MQKRRYYSESDDPSYKSLIIDVCHALAIDLLDTVEGH